MAKREVDSYPDLYSILSPSDQLGYQELQSRVASPENRYNRNKRLATFQDILDEIRQYCEQGDPCDSWKRYLVCGICWLNSEIAINTRQLRILIAKSKSSINGAFAKMGYETVPSKSEDSSLLLQTIPYLKSHFAELRQWTVRRRAFSSPTPRLYSENYKPTPPPKCKSPVLDQELLSFDSFDMGLFPTIDFDDIDTIGQNNFGPAPQNNIEDFELMDDEFNPKFNPPSPAIWNEYEPFPLQKMDSSFELDWGQDNFQRQRPNSIYTQ